jgi:hypothetical protein
VSSIPDRAWTSVYAGATRLVSGSLLGGASGAASGFRLCPCEHCTRASPCFRRSLSQPLSRCPGVIRPTAAYALAVALSPPTGGSLGFAGGLRGGGLGVGIGLRPDGGSGGAFRGGAFRAGVFSALAARLALASSFASFLSRSRSRPSSSSMGSARISPCIAPVRLLPVGTRRRAVTPARRATSLTLWASRSCRRLSLAMRVNLHKPRSEIRCDSQLGPHPDRLSTADEARTRDPDIGKVRLQFRIRED